MRARERLHAALRSLARIRTRICIWIEAYRRGVMSRINFAFGVLVLPLTIFSTQAQPLPQPDPGTAIVSGVVKLKGEPSCGVTVRLSDQRPRPFNNHTVKTDKNGRFRIANVA